MDHLQYLFNKYKNNQSTAEEVQELLDLFCVESEAEMLKEFIYQAHVEEVIAEQEDLKLDRLMDEVYGNLQSKIFEETNDRIRTIKFNSWKWTGFAAAIGVAILSIGLLFNKLNDHAKQSNDTAYQNDIPPGKQGATLTLANGTQIKMSDVGNGELARQAGVTIIKLASGQLIYEMKQGTVVADRNVINTLTTGNGETYTIRLPDGTLVFLNAGSSLSYPASFGNSDRRKVSLVGEGYFEVAKDKQHPFIVHTNYQEVEVLGTHFNINSYAEEGETKTTLLEGLVKVSGSAGTRVLQPGQQAELSVKGISVKNVEVEDAVAWKNGYFMFNSERLESIMNRIARWYNVKLIYEDPELKKETFFGRVSRSEHIEKVLTALEGTDVLRFEIEGNLIKIKRKNK